MNVTYNLKADELNAEFIQILKDTYHQNKDRKPLKKINVLISDIQR